jgi:hypothetical protein
MRVGNSWQGQRLTLALTERQAVTQRLLSVNRERRVHGVDHIAIIQALGQVPCGRPVPNVALALRR